MVFKKTLELAVKAGLFERRNRPGDRLNPHAGSSCERYLRSFKGWYKKDSFM